MGLFETVVVFVISWWLCFLPSLSAGNQSQAETDSVVAGSEPGAPTSWSLRKKATLATILAGILTVVFWSVAASGLLDGYLP